MSAFDKVIGYDTIKTELLQVCDMIHNRRIYEELGAKMPKGVLLYGDVGLGKTLLAKCFLEESGLNAFVVRRNKGNDDFIREITATFRKAKENAPCVILLDDLDKFANEDNDHCDAPEYVAVQSGIDDVKNCDVFVVATANEISKLPDSLLRPGRFDRKIEVQCPTDHDAEEIIKHYLSDKKVSKTVHFEDLAKMISYSSCAELETIINEAAISAAYHRKPCIETEDLVQSVLRVMYDSPGDFAKASAEDMKKTALHEAGHLVVAEVLCPGSVGLASLCAAGGNDVWGFIHRCKGLPEESYRVPVFLAGKAAVELYYSDTRAKGCWEDIARAYTFIREGISLHATHGLGMVGGLNGEKITYPGSSENMNARRETITNDELERYMFLTRDILIKNRAFLEKATAALIEKKTLLYSDISAIRANTAITEVNI